MSARHSAFPPPATTLSSPAFRARRGASFLATFVALVLFASVGLAGSQESIDDARERREAVRAEQSRVAAELDVLAAEQSELLAVLGGLDEALSFQEARVEAVEQSLAARLAEVTDIQRGLAELDAQEALLTDQASTMLVDSYIGANKSTAAWLDSTDLDAAVKRDVILGQVQGDVEDVLDQLRGLREDGEFARAEAELAAADVRAKRDLVAIERDQLAMERAVQARIEGELRTRIGDFEQKASSLEADEQTINAVIRARQLEQEKLSAPALSEVSTEGFVRPIDAPPGSPFGKRRHPVLGTVRLHAGVDFGAPSGTAIWSAKDGEVIFAGRQSGYGNTVMVDHGGGAVTLYAHMSKILAQRGQRVAAGEIVGKVGSTGLSTGPHLHFEVRVNGVARNPMLFIP